jgi:hypothetical protein
LKTLLSIPTVVEDGSRVGLPSTRWHISRALSVSPEEYYTSFEVKCVNSGALREKATSAILWPFERPENHRPDPYQTVAGSEERVVEDEEAQSDGVVSDKNHDQQNDVNAEADMLAGAVGKLFNYADEQMMNEFEEKFELASALQSRVEEAAGHERQVTRVT